MIPLVIVYLYLGLQLQAYYMRLYREATRLQNITSSPISQAFTELIYGGKVVRAFRCEDYIMQDYMSIVNENQKNLMLSNASKQWFNQRIQFLNFMIVVPSILLSIFVLRVSSGYFAVLLIYMISITDDLKRFLTNVSKMESRFISFERCHFFMNIPAEQGYKHLAQHKRAYRKMIQNNSKSKDLDLIPMLPNWPSVGKIEFENYSVKYRPDLDYVLKNITFSIAGGSKLGILGRTGAGKSTLISSIFRYFGQFEGDILIDGMPIRNVDLQVLRKSMTIIPQDPILFNATLKKNLDPAGTHDDNKIIEVLEEVNLLEKFKDKGINTMIEAGGSNLSQGEKQLLCFARALLENNKIILMDEATANIDRNTENTIQTLVKQKFNNATILMIAHKLNTIMICDK